MVALRVAVVALVLNVCAAESADKNFFNVFCKLDEKQNLECEVDVRDWDPSTPETCTLKELDFCGQWTTKKQRNGRRVVSGDPPPEGTMCLTSRPCLAVNAPALVLAAAGQQETNTEEGLTKYIFRIDNKWEPTKIPSGEIELRLTPEMLTSMGFCSIDLGHDPVDVPEPAKPADKKYYVGISGGGWRALSGHMGVFRVLSELGALEIVDMFSSVSGGTWFLTKLAFDNDFSTKVLSSKDSIAEVVMEWMESEYFRAFRNVKRTEASPDDPEKNLKLFISTIISQGPDALKTAVGTGIVAFDYFDFSWQNFVENTILGSEVANTELTKATVAANTLSKFGKDFNLAFNWNQQNKFEDEKRTFFLKETDGQHVQYPAYVSAVYEHKSGSAKPEVSVLMRAQNPSEIFQICSQNKGDEEEVGGFGGFFHHDKTPEEIAQGQTCNDFKFDFSELTIGQAASASSAAAGPVACETWVQSLVEFARVKARTAGGMEKGLTCGVIKTVLKRVISPCQREVVMDEVAKLLDCTSEDSKDTADRWSHFLRKMAIKFKMSSSKGETAESYMAFDAGLNENSGLTPIISNYLQDDSATSAQVLVLIINSLGDNQMELYFNHFGDETGGLMCEGVLEGDNTHKAYERIDKIYKKSFVQIAGQYKKQKREKTCPIRLAPSVFFKGHAPQHQRFPEKKIPNHITYAYQKDVEILRNDKFYAWTKNGQPKKIDLLFLMSSAPVSTISEPESGSESYLGVAVGMQMAMKSLSEKFPSFFVEAK